MSTRCPEISVVMPFYNGAAWLRETIAGFLKQDFESYELILVDDGSTDESLSIATSFSQKDARVAVISLPRCGAGESRNAGLAMAQGKYVLFLDSDDVFEPVMLSHFYRKAEDSAADIVVCGADAFRVGAESSRVALKTSKRLNPGVYRTRDISEQLFQCFGTQAWNKFMRTDLIRSHGLSFQNIPRSNDVLFVCAALAHSEVICVTDETLVHYRMASGGDASSLLESGPFCDLLAYDSLRKLLAEGNLFGEERPGLRRSLDNACMSMVVSNMLKCMVVSPDTAGRFSDEYFEDYERAWGIGGEPFRYAYYYSKERAFAYRRLRLLNAEGIALAGRCCSGSAQATRAKKVVMLLNTVVMSLPFMPFRREVGSDE